MNILFLTMSNIRDIEAHGIYTDLMRKFRNEGHRVYIAAPRERRTGEATNLKEISGAKDRLRVLRDSASLADLIFYK